MNVIKIIFPNNEKVCTEDAILESFKIYNNLPQTAHQITSTWHYNWPDGKHELPGLDVHTIEAKLLEMANLGILRKVPRRGKDEHGYEFFMMVSFKKNK